MNKLVVFHFIQNNELHWIKMKDLSAVWQNIFHPKTNFHKSFYKGNILWLPSIERVWSSEDLHITNSVGSTGPHHHFLNYNMGAFKARYKGLLAVIITINPPK